MLSMNRLLSKFYIFHESSFISHFHFSTAAQSKLNLVLKEIEQLHSIKLIDDDDDENRNLSRNRTAEPLKSIEISHPWPEWVNLIEILVKKGYFSGDAREIGPRDSNRVRTACLNFARDRFDLIRYLSRKDIQLVVGSGCPSLDRKVVNSGKRLRAHVGIDEGNVCSICTLRGNCERAYMKPLEDEVGQSVDVVRILLTYGMDHISGSVENEQCHNKTIKDSVRGLLNQMTEFSTRELDSGPLKTTSNRLKSRQEKNEIKVPMKQGDWICPKCNFLNFAKNVRCLRCNGLWKERLQKLGEDQDYLPMKKGDWLCEKCNFLNFAKNTKCLQCKEKPLNRQLNPGEWECVSCSYVNFRKNLLCLRCGWKRPKAFNDAGNSDQFQKKDQNYHQWSFVRNDNEDSRATGDTDSWSTGEDDDTEDDWSSPKAKYSSFKDFPIVGGSSIASRDPLEMEKWKDKMSRRDPLEMEKWKDKMSRRDPLETEKWKDKMSRRDPLEMERWKGKMSGRSKGTAKVGEREGSDDLGSANFENMPDFKEVSSDDEMAGWFGCGKGKKIEI